MEVLKTILNDSSAIIDDPRLETNDKESVFENFLSEYSGFHDKHIDDSDPDLLTDTLLKLEERHLKINDLIERIIPKLIDYLVDLNNRLFEYTGELRLIKKKSAELKTVSQYNSEKLAHISPLVNDLLISTKVVNEIISGKITLAWVDNISFVKDKQAIYNKYMTNRNKGITDVETENVNLPKDFENMYEVLEILKTIIIERSKKFIIHKLRVLRSSKPVPSQKVQVQLLQLSNIFKFLIENNYSLALEIRQAYIYTMKWYYKEYFGRYIRSLTILQFNYISNQYSLGNVVLNSNSSNTSSLFTNYLPTSYAATVTNAMIKDYFNISKRLSILYQEDNTVMVSQIAETNHNKNNFIELGFKNLNLAILDNCAVEFYFLTRFFQISDNEEEIKGILEQIFQPTLLHALEYFETILLSTYVFDIFGVLISVRITKQLQFESQKRNLPLMENFLNDQLMLLWPKFQQLVDWQSKSINELSASSLTFNKTDVLSSAHDLTIALSIFLNSLLLLSIYQNNEDARSEPLYNSILRIRNDFESIMTRISKLTKNPEKFLSINYLYIYNSLQQQSLSLSGTNEVKETSGKKDDMSIMQETEYHFKTLVEAFNQTY